jgi:hypothetical protein
MDRPLSDESESRFLAYVEGLVGAIGHADRAAPFCGVTALGCWRVNDPA